MSLVRENPQTMVQKASLLARLGTGVLGFLDGFRAALLSALQEENSRATKVAEKEDDKDLFDNLPDPPPHLDIGDVKYFDGRFRYF